MEQAPQVTPEMYAELMGQEGQQPTVQDNAVQQPQQQQQTQMQQQGMRPEQPAMQQQPAEPTPDDIEQAKKLLGLNEIQEHLERMMAENVRAAVSAKYPDVPYEIVEKEIEKVAAIDPNFAKAMRTTPEGMDMAYRSAMAAYKPQEKPDNLTEDEGNGGQEEDPLLDKVKSGNADDVVLGDYILGIR